MPKKTPNRQQVVNPLISLIEVEDLFYTYTYTLKVAPPLGPESGSLMLLYGDNGSGKTTILNILYHLLHPEPKGGHRAFIGGIPFKTFKVELFGDTTISALRPDKCGQGEYSIKISSHYLQDELIWKWDDAVDKRRSKANDDSYEKYCSFLKKLELSFHYLRDTRRVEGNPMTMGQAFRRSFPVVPEELIFIENISEEQLVLPERQLAESINIALQWFQQRALLATKIGYTNIDTIYRDIIKQVVMASTSDSDAPTSTLKELSKSLIELKEKNVAFEQFGLTPELNVDNIVKSLEAAESKHITMLNTVLKPYLDGHAARFEALRELQRVIQSFVMLLCESYSHKKVSVDLQKGLKITSDSGQELEPIKLSSGEKQLLLLFCNAISSRKDKTVLIIDEPEISLNVKWQRKLIPALLTCMSGTNFQLILATHSVELLTQYRDIVSPLENMHKAGINE
jgi:energy-coupling factor transporter ATP-binding protein EcfA2